MAEEKSKLQEGTLTEGVILTAMEWGLKALANGDDLEARAQRSNGHR